MLTSKKGPFGNRPSQFIMIAALIIFYVIAFSQKTNFKISYDSFKAQIHEGNIKEVTMIGPQEIHGTLHQELLPTNEKVFNSRRQGRYFQTLVPAIGDINLLPLLEKNNVKIRAKSDSPGLLTSILINLLPWIIIFGFFYYNAKKMGQGGLGGMRPGSGFPSFKPKDKKEKNQEKIDYSFVAGQENAKKELSEIIDFLKSPEKYEKIGANLPKGILLVGPPGTGKTLMARATAGEADVSFFNISGSEFIELYVGMGASRVRNLFESARKAAPSIIFIDEIDSIGRVRGSGLGGGHDEREQTLNQILSEMDGFDSNGAVVVLAATNRPDVLDPALTRPGRFDRQVTLNLPQLSARHAILELYGKKVPLSKEVDLFKMAQASIGFSGADLKNLVNEAALYCARRNGASISNEDFNEARDKIIMGVPREEQIKETDKKIIAIHESGHAIVAMKTPHTDPVRKVSIMPRGMALGHTEQTPTEDKLNVSKSYLIGQIKTLLGGRYAEKMIFNEITTGAENDLKRATKLAQKMVINWGMSDKLGPLAYNQGEEHMFLGRELSHPKEFSEKTGELIDQEIKSIINNAKESVIKLLEEHKDLILKMSSDLLEKETLTADDLKEFL